MAVFDEFLGGLSRSARTGLIAGAALIALGLTVALWWLFTPRYQLLFGNLRESAAAEITKSLADWKVPYRFTEGGTGIEVPADQVYDTRMKLVSAGVPSGGHVGFELFDHSDFGVTEFDQRVTYQRALQGELERSISALPGVEAVRVHLTIRRPGLFIGQDDSSKASVAVTMSPGQNLTPQQVGGIRNLVASAVDGLSPNGVVVMGPGGVLQGGAVNTGEQSGVLAQNDEQANYESRVRERINDLLGQVFHGQAFRVSVDVRLNFDQEHHVSEHLLGDGPDGNGLLVHRRTSSAGGNSLPADDKEKPAVAPSQKQEDVDYAHGSERDEVARAPGRVERISVAVLVPSSLDDAQLQNLRELVSAAAGIDEKRGDRLEITSVGDVPLPASTVTQAGSPNEGVSVVPASVGPTNGREHGGGIPGYWLALTGLLGAIVGAGLVVVLRPRPPRLRSEEREAVLSKLHSWLAEGGTST